MYKPISTAWILEYYKCRDCNWPIIAACCNDDFVKFKDAGDWDWWHYCSNKGCINHEGEGVWQSTPDWNTKDD